MYNSLKKNNYDIIETENNLIILLTYYLHSVSS